MIGNMVNIAVSHPGKVGDALYSIPTIRYLTFLHGCKADFYTSDFVRIAADLFEYQSCIDRVIIPDEYEVERTDVGIQPWDMPVPGGTYKAVYHLGYRGTPDTRLDHFIGKSIGVHPANLPKVQYEYPTYMKLNLPDEFYVLDTRTGTSYNDLFKEWSLVCKYPVVLVGSPANALPEFGHCINLTGKPFYWTPYIMSKARGFVGIMSSHLVLANGFDFPKVVPHNDKSWDMRHVIYSDSNFYLVDPAPEDILEILE